MTFFEYCSMRDAQAMQVDEAFFDSLKSGFSSGYTQAKGSAEQDYEKYAPAAQKAIASVSGKAKEYSEKLGIPLPLATALLAAGLTGGPAALPFAALLYFVKKPLMGAANKAFDTTWNAAANLAKTGQQQPQQPQQPQQQQQQQQPGKFQMPPLSSGGYTSGSTQKVGSWPSNMQPLKAEHLSFREFVEIMEAASWGDWAGEKIGGAAGWLAGKTVGFGSKIVSSISQRAKEVAAFAKNNPKEVARMLFLIGAGAAIGAGIGKITDEVKGMIMQNIQSAAPDADISSLSNVPSDGGEADSITGAGQSQTTSAADDFVNNKAGAMQSQADVAAQAKSDTANAVATGGINKSGVDMDTIQGTTVNDWKQSAKKAFMDAHKNDPAYNTEFAKKFGKLAREAAKFADKESLIQFGQQTMSPDGSTTYFMGKDPNNFSRLTIRK